jgi:hypothetical protein
MLSHGAKNRKRGNGGESQPMAHPPLGPALRQATLQKPLFKTNLKINVH